jgi:hypothetical protein
LWCSRSGGFYSLRRQWPQRSGPHNLGFNRSLRKLNVFEPRWLVSADNCAAPTP